MLQREWERLDTKGCCNENGRSWRRKVATSKEMKCCDKNGEGGSRRGAAMRMGEARNVATSKDKKCCNEHGKGECCNEDRRSWRRRNVATSKEKRCLRLVKDAVAPRVRQ